MKNDTVLAFYEYDVPLDPVYRRRESYGLQEEELLSSFHSRRRRHQCIVYRIQ